jgi:hypothetical protein
MNDLISWFPSVGAASANFSSAWSAVFLGRVMSLAPFEFLLQAVLNTITLGDAALAQGIFYLSLLPVSSVTMYFFLRHLITSNLGHILVSILYGVNGITIVWFLGGGYATLPLHAFFPLLMLYLIKILEGGGKGNILNMLIFSLFLGLIASYQVRMHMLWLFSPFIIVFFGTEIAHRRSWKYLHNRLLLFLGSSVIIVFLLAPTLFNQIYDVLGYFKNPETASIFAGGYNVDYLSQSIVDNYTLETTVNMFLNFTYVVAFLACFTFFMRKNKNSRYFLNFLLIATSLLLFARVLYMGWILNLFRAIPILFIVRSPSTLAFMLCWSIFPMMAILIDEVKKRTALKIKPMTKLKKATVLTPLCIIIILLSFFITPDWLPPGSSESSDNVAIFFSGWNSPSSHDLGEIPLSFDRIRLWLDLRREDEGFFRTLWLPCERFVGAKVLVRYDPLTLAGSSTELDYMSLSLLPLLQGNTEEVGKLLAPYNVKYIVISLERWEGKFLEPYYRGTPRIAQQEPWGWWPMGDPEEYVALINKQEDLKLVANDPDFLIYQNMDFIPQSHITVYTDTFFVAPIDSISDKLPSSGENLIFNSGFENGLDPWVAATNLRGSKYSIDNVISFSGQSSLKMEMYEIGSYATVSQTIPVTENASYYLSLWSRGKNTELTYCRVYFYNTNDEVIVVDNENYSKIWLTLSEDWSEQGTLIETPANAVRMKLNIDIGMEWAFIDKSVPVTVWFDNMTLMETVATNSPVQNWNYLYGYAGPFEAFPEGFLEGWNGDIEAFPYSYLHGQILVRIPELLSKVPYLTDSNHLLVYGDFVSNEELSTYLTLSIAIIFLGDIETSNPYDVWTSEQKPLLFVHEAEASLIFKPIQKEISPSVVADDNQTLFWKASTSGIGTIGVPQLSDEKTEKISGSDCLRLIVGNGTGASWYIYHEYPTTQDWSAKNSLNLNWYGRNSGEVVQVSILSTTPTDVFQATFIDNFLGWKQINLPFNTFSSVGNPDWSAINYIDIQMTGNSILGTWYLDRTVIDIESHNQRLIEGESLSYGYGIELEGNWLGTKQFFAPKASYYRVLIRSQSDRNLTIEIDGQSIDLVHSYDGDNGFNLYETASLFLDTGEHELLFEFQGDTTVVDQFLILSTENEDDTFGSIFYSNQPLFNYTQISPSEYTLDLSSDESCLLILSDSFHPEWLATSNDDETLEHLQALSLGWANGFYLSQGGNNTVNIIFGRQPLRNISLIIWEISLVSLLVAIGCFSMSKAIKQKVRFLWAKVTPSDNA